MFEAPEAPELDHEKFSQKPTTSIKWKPTVLNPDRVKQDLTEQGFQSNHELENRLLEDEEQWDFIKSTNDASVREPTKNRVSIVLTPAAMEPDPKRRKL